LEMIMELILLSALGTAALALAELCDLLRI
jgi:hypothetical protein